VRCFASARLADQRQVGTLLSCLWYPTKAEKSVTCTNHDPRCGLLLLSSGGALLYFAGSALPVSESTGWPKGGVEGCLWTETALLCCLSDLIAEFHYVFLSFSCVEGVWVARRYGWSRLDVQIRYVHWGVGELTVGQINVTAEVGAARFLTRCSPLFLKGVAHFPISQHHFPFRTL